MLVEVPRPGFGSAPLAERRLACETSRELRSGKGIRMGHSTSNFVLCGGCSRHFRAEENRCPFCAAPRSTARQRPRPAPLAPGAARSLRYAVRAALFGGVMVACSDSESGGTGT